MGKPLYQEIDRQVALEGFHLRTLEVHPGPDRSAASAQLHANRRGALSFLHQGPSSAHAYLKIDRLEDDVWYVRTALDPKIPVRMPGELDLEFLVSATDPVPKRRHAALIEAGRAKQKEVVSLASKWQAVLPNEATVEFIGVCENPSGGKDWWGPDGSRLDAPPYLNYERYSPPREDLAIYEIAWRVTIPAGGPSGTRSSLEGAVGSYGRQICDRYGNTIHAGLDAQGYAFEKSRTKTTLTLGVRIGQSTYEWVRFENISLLPAQNPGFQIVEGTDAAPK